MKTFMKQTLLAASVIMALGACGSKKNDKAPEGGLVVKVDTPTETNSNVTVTKDAKGITDANGLADAGEQLVGPYTFMLADKVFDNALQVDPNNKKAQFYKSFLKRMMVFKGVLTRVRPVVRLRGDSAQLEQNIKMIPESPGKQFLMDGKEDIRTVADIQNLLVQYREALNDFRKFAKSNVDLELTLNLNPHVFEKEIRDQSADSCVVTPNSDSSVQVVCDYTKSAQKKINSADMVSFAQITSGEILMWTLYTSYDVSTIEKLMDDGSFKEQTPEQQLATLKTYPSIAKLRADQSLSLIPELGADLSAAIKWGFEYQNRLCPKGAGAVNNRRGFVFSQGICMTKTSETDRSLALLDQALKGAVKMPVFDQDGRQSGEVTVDIVKFLTQPPQDLRSVLPNQVDSHGQVTRQGTDKTFGGLFPEGDAEILTRK